MDLNFNGRVNGFNNGNEWEVNLENDLIITNGYWIMNDEQN